MIEQKAKPSSKRIGKQGDDSESDLSVDFRASIVGKEKKLK